MVEVISGIELLEISSGGHRVKGTLLRIPILVSKFLTNKIYFISKISQIYYFITEVLLLYKFQPNMNKNDSEQEARKKLRRIEINC